MSEQPAIAIREAMLSDYARLASLSDEVHALHAAAHPTIFRQVERGKSLAKGWFDELLSNDATTIQIAEVEGIIAGFAIVEVVDAPPVEILVPARTAFVQSMVVTETRRGQGIGRALIEAAKVWSRAKGATALELTVWEFNQPARTFYERLGFTSLHRTMIVELQAGASTQRSEPA
jgi:GNAT superfamily N-acetyltransferase